MIPIIIKIKIPIDKINVPIDKVIIEINDINKLSPEPEEAFNIIAINIAIKTPMTLTINPPATIFIPRRSRYCSSNSFLV